jgi:Protein of unknown function (DUF3606)
MTRDSFVSGPVDRSRIELIEGHELRFWTRELQCSAEQLLEAIESVGIDAAAVGDYLAMRLCLNRPMLQREAPGASA